MFDKKNMNVGCVQSSTVYILPILNTQPSLILPPCPHRQQSLGGSRVLYLTLLPTGLLPTSMALFNDYYHLDHSIKDTEPESVLFSWLPNYSFEMILYHFNCHNTHSLVTGLSRYFAFKGCILSSSKTLLSLRQSK